VRQAPVEIFARSAATYSQWTVLYNALEGPFCRGLTSYRSVKDPEAEHGAGFALSAPQEVEALEVRWPAGYSPRAWRLVVWGVDGVERASAWVDAGGALSARWAPGEGLVARVELQQRPGGGSAENPSQMQVASLRLLPAASAARAWLERLDGSQEALAPWLQGGDPCGQAVPVGHARAVGLSWERARGCGAVCVVAARQGASGGPAAVAAWLGSVREVELRQGGQWRAVEVSARGVDAARAGLAAGRVAGWLSWAPQEGVEALRVPLPGLRESLWALLAVEAAASAPDELAPVEASDSPLYPSPDLAGIEAALSGAVPEWQAGLAQVSAPQRLSASLGWPGEDARAGLAPDGELLVRPGEAAPHGGSYGQCLHLGLGLGLDGEAPVRLQEWPGAQRLRWASEALPTVHVHAHLPEYISVFQDFVPLEGGLLGWLARVQNVGSEAREVTLWLGAALRDLFWRLPVGWAPAEASEGMRAWRWPGGGLALALDEDWEVIGEEGDDLRLSRRARLAPGESLVSVIQVALRAGAEVRPWGEWLPPLADAVEALWEGASPWELPDGGWDRLTRAWMVWASVFVRGRGEVRYGSWPSMYDDSTFGLEEDYLFAAMGAWGATGPALRLLEATYLTPKHLDPSHYLYDLRAGLTPWQVWRLRGLDGSTWSEAERAALEALGRWIQAGREATAGADGAADARGVRVFAGLLPASRYGGDLDFPTQSLSTNAACWAGLRALAALRGDEALAAEAEGYRAALLAAMDAVRRPSVGDIPEYIPWDTGGGEAGSYHALMAGGIVAPLDLWPGDDPRGALVDAHLEASGALLGGLPRFDDWGHAGIGIDGHYAVGYLLRALRLGRREVFVRGLRALVGLSMDPEVFTFREVAPVHGASPCWGAEFALPGCSLGRSEPCVGSPGVGLQLVRHALVTERLGQDGQPGASLLALWGAPDEWWSSGAPLRFGPVPTCGGPVSLSLVWAWEGRCALSVEAPGAREVEVRLPWGAGWALLESDCALARVEGAVLWLPPGRWSARLERRS
jgi:hypothetical protein